MRPPACRHPSCRRWLQAWATRGATAWPQDCARPVTAAACGRSRALASEIASAGAESAACRQENLIGGAEAASGADPVRAAATAASALVGSRARSGGCVTATASVSCMGADQTQKWVTLATETVATGPRARAAVSGTGRVASGTERVANGTERGASGTVRVASGTGRVATESAAHEATESAAQEATENARVAATGHVMERWLPQVTVLPWPGPGPKHVTAARVQPAAASPEAGPVLRGTRPTSPA